MMRTAERFFFALLLILALVAGCAKTPEAGLETKPAAATSSASLISRDVLFGNPDKGAVRLSPDGTRISFLADVDGVMNVFVGPVNDPDAAKPVTKDKERGIRQYFWSYDNRHILYLQDQGGDENWRVYSVNLDDDEIRDLTPFEKVRAEVAAVSHLHPSEIVIGLNDRDPELHDLYRVNLETGSRSLLQYNDGYVGYVLDDDYGVRFAMKMNPDGGSAYFKATAEGGWEPYLTIGPDDALTTQVFGFDKTGRALYMLDSRGRNTAALVSLSLDSGKETVIFEDPKADVSGAMIHPTEYTVQAASATYERTEWTILDEAIRPDWDRLQKAITGDIAVIDRTLDDQMWMVVGYTDDGPVRYYRYDRGTGELKFLFTNLKALENLPLVKMHPVQVKSRDGLTLVNYLSLPLQADPDGDGIPDKPLPMVLSVHGGPWSRAGWGYNPWHQWFANRGYAVLDVNFRGSTGFGKNFINAANLEWGGRMHDDLIDSVNWAVQNGIADPNKIAIMGGSYGGYATLAGMTMTPDTFACGVDIVGPSNLTTLIRSVPPYWKPMIDLFKTRVGDPDTEAGRRLLDERSPLTYADKIKKPLLIAQGANDPRVKRAESDQIVAAMKKNGIPVTYVLYPDEGHGFARRENRLSFYAVSDAFLANCLGGRFEPVGNDFDNSSIEILDGEDLIPGLKGASAVRR